MKKKLNFWLLAALVCGMSLSVTSCKDNDDNELSPEEQEKQAQEQLEKAEQEMTAFNVLDYLADMSNAPADYLTGSYEPAIGVPDGDDTGTRIVITNDMETAAMRFGDLIDASIDENTSEYTWKDDKVGTLTYTKTTDGKSWATVDVSIKQIPHLQKIIYRSPEQADNNGKFTGTAYYRFGDVISRMNEDGQREYWFCVCPAFGPEGKVETHWISISRPPSKNVWTYPASNGFTYALPTLLGTNAEQAQNFAEMLFAICYPEQWERNIINNPKTGLFNKGIPMFGDFDKANVKYHSQYFWQRVQNAWTKHNIFYEHFGGSCGLEYFQNVLREGSEGLYLLTNGYSWWTTSSNKPTLYRYHFTNGTGKESNMHHKDPGSGIRPYTSISAEVIAAKIKLNVNDDFQPLTPYLREDKFFGTIEPHYIMRHATGAELAEDGHENQYLPLRGTYDVYNYNTEYGITNLNVDPEVLDRPTGKVVNSSAQQLWKPYRGDSHYRFGDIYKDENGHKWMVLLMSGSHFKNGKTFDGDSACFTELVSIDGLTPSADKGKITNLPTRDQAIRAATFLFYYQIYTNNLKLKVESEELKKDPLKYLELGKTVLNQVETCNFDVRMLYQIVRAQQQAHWNREPSYMGSIAYNDPNDTSGKQRLLRFICNMQNDYKMPCFYLWEHYVDSVDSSSELYAPERYGTLPIYS